MFVNCRCPENPPLPSFFVNKYLLLYRSWHTCARLYKYPVCLVCVRNGLRANRITFETKKVEEKRLILSIGRTRTSKGPLLGRIPLLVIGRNLIRKGHLPGCTPMHVIGTHWTQKCSSQDKPATPNPLRGSYACSQGNITLYIPCSFTQLMEISTVPGTCLLPKSIATFLCLAYYK